MLYSFLGLIRGIEEESVVSDTSHDDHIITETKNLHEGNAHDRGTTEIHSSFSEEVTTEKIAPPQSTIDDASLLKNIQVASE